MTDISIPTGEYDINRSGQGRRRRRAGRFATGRPRAASAKALTLALLAAALPVRAEETTVLDTLVVTATRVGQSPYEALAASSAISRDRLALEAQGGSLADVVRLVPGLTTQMTANDPGTGINVRGMQDFGRVNVMIDGARQNFQKNGHQANGTVYFDSEMLKSIDVTRGPSSSIYGSGAIGGVVSLTTIDADDIIADGADFGGRMKTTIDTNGPGPAVHGEVGWRPSEMVDIAAAASWKSIGDYTTGEGVVVPSAQEMLSGLAKARIRPAEGHELTLSAMRSRNSFANGVSRDVDTTADTASIGYRFTPSDSELWDLTAKLYYTGTRFEQVDLLAKDDKSFAIGTIGLDLFNTSRFATGPAQHELTYGGDIFHDRVDTVDAVGTSDDLTPSGDRVAWGAFVQDRVTVDDWLEVIGALRYDAYSIRNDKIAADGGRLSPKLTVGVTPWEPLTLYATYAEGYRAPALTEMLIDGFHPPPVSTGRFFPNPLLRPEVAHSIEGGVNLRFEDTLVEGDSFRMKATAFRNDVDDYIDQVFIIFPIPGGYQYQNVAKARVQGIELEASYDTGFLFAGVSGQILEGTNLLTGDPLQKVPPYSVSGTLGVRLLEETLTLGGRVTHVGAKPEAADLGFVGEAYELVDLFASYKINENASANLALNNIFNRQYTQYLNGSPSPGFNARLSLTTSF